MPIYSAKGDISSKARYKKWFCEESVPGKRSGKVKHCFLIEKTVFNGKTPFQEVLIFDNSLYGRIFCLENIVQFSQIDEFIYHEMIVHPILFSHRKPENILIIGGGDGGVLREVLKHPINKADLVEIDKKVIEISKKHLRFICQDSFSAKRVKVFNLPGQDFVKKNKNLYDILIIDCTNPAPGSGSFPLYSLNFYKNVFEALKEDGMMIVLGASFLDFKFVEKIVKKIGRVFPSTLIFKFCMPSYHCGEYCFVGASKKVNLAKVNFNKINQRFKKLQKKHRFQYYSPDIHRGSIILPEIWQVKK